MVDRGHRTPRVGHVARVALVGAADVRGRFAGCEGAVVATGAGAADFRMVDGYRGSERRRAMTPLAGIAGIDVRGVLAGGGDAVVAAGTVVGDSGVVENCGIPRRRVVAGVALRRCRDVVDRFSGCAAAVMASRAYAKHLGMIDDSSRRPGDGGMARFAGRGRRDVVGRLTRRVGAVMATGAIARDAAVIVSGRVPGNRRVAGVALGRRRNMVDRLAGRRGAVMTA